MFARKSVKIFVIFIVLTNLFSACRWWKSLTDAPSPTPTPFIAQEIPTNIPFQTKEPDNYQAEFSVSTFSGNEKTEKKTFTARKGTKYFTTFNVGEKSAFSSLKTGTGVDYLISDDKKIFTEEYQSSNSAAESEESLGNFLTTEWLNGKTSVTFENLGNENNISKFRAKPESAQNTEILLYVDENLKFPVKQEFYSVSGEQKKLMFSAEILNFNSQPDEKHFELPNDYRKVSRKEFDKIIYQEE